MKHTLITSVVLSVVISACGGGGSDSAVTPPAVTPPVVTPPTPVEPATFTGMFVDSAVEGLNYSTPSGTGVTNENGEFTYQLNEKVTFSLGGITFPEVDAKSVLTPLDLFDTTDINHEAVVNTLRLLQTLDADGDAENGITIPTLVRTLANAITLDLSDVDFESKISDFLSTASLDNLLVSSVDAIYHFQNTLDGLIVEGRCGQTSSKIGHSGSFSTLAHNVSGTATIISDCEIEITNFSYDGGGPKVYLYGGIDNNYEASSAFPLGNELQGQIYENASFTISLPNNKTLDDLTGLSVWCADFNADFGNMTFTP
jgi:hypothetical protein